MMKKVLIAIDFNPVSEKVAEKGYELAKNMDAEVCLIHILSDVGYYGARYPSFLGYDGYSATIGPDFDLAIEMRGIAEEFLEKAAEHLNDPRVKTKLAEGGTAKTLLQYAEEWQADLIVMGTHSHSVLEKLLVGTVTEKVLEKTSIPVYLVPVKK
jgi:nucleotide-binding universal stress UspA family protein